MELVNPLIATFPYSKCLHEGRVQLTWCLFKKRNTLSYLCGGRQSSQGYLPINTPSVYKPPAELVSSCRGDHYTTGHLNQRKTQSWLQTPSSFKGVAVEVITPVIATLVYSKQVHITNIRAACCYCSLDIISAQAAVSK